MDFVSDTHNRLGIFELPEAVLRNTPEKLAPVFQQVVVLSAVKVFGRDVHQYVGYCEQFEWVVRGQKAPFYEVSKRGETVIFKKVDHE